MYAKGKPQEIITKLKGGPVEHKNLKTICFSFENYLILVSGF